MKKPLLFLFAFLASFSAILADTEVKFDFTNPASLGYAIPTDESFTELNNNDQVKSGAVILTNIQNGSSSSLFGTITYKTRFANTNGNIEFQIRNRSVVTFATDNGQHIKKIVFKGSVLKKDKSFDNGCYTATSDSTAEWNGDDETITLTIGASGEMYITEAIVTLGEASSVAYPTFSSNGDILYNGVNTPKTITLATTTDGATLKYRFAGEENWTDYTEAGVQITKTCIVEAKAVLGDNESSIVKASYIVNQVAEVTSMAELSTHKQDEMVKIIPALTVVYHNFGSTSNIYATNGTDVFNILDGDVYGTNIQLTAQLPQGTVLAAGITGLKHDSGSLNFKPEVRSLITETLVPTEEKVEVTPNEMTLTDLTTKADEAYNKYLVLKGVKIAAYINPSTKKTVNNNFTISDDSENTVRLFNRFALDMTSLEDVKYNVEGFLINNGTMDQFYPISIVAAVTSGIETVKNTDNQADTTTYNIVGQRVANTQKGIVIKAGKKTLNK